MPEGSDEPEVIPPAGTEIAIELRWKDAKGKTQSAPRRIGSAIGRLGRPWIRIGFSLAASS